MINWLTDIFHAIGDGFSALGESMGAFFTSLGQSIVGLFGNLHVWFTDLGADIGDWFKSVFKGLGDIFNSIGDIFVALGDWFANLFKQIGDILLYLNPFSDKFFLKIALVPDDDFMETETKKLNETFKSKFEVVYQLRDTLEVLFERAEGSQWQGIKFKIPLTGQTVTIVDPVPVNEIGYKVKFWSGGLLLFFLLAWVYKRITTEVIK